ncbi:MAG: hypothetical protein BGN88_12535 [Clostridiales bacterium 43-6]|nr:MAG: hypothetical protein BGN88_12535 [Clostridiales bacterium 43-6]
MYNSESELVNKFIDVLLNDTIWDVQTISTEFNYLRGKTDIVILSSNNEVIAVEAKLSKWRNALHQAYRNKCFADKSYVLLPLETAETAAKYKVEFKKRGIGICCIEENRVTIFEEAITDEPLQPWLRQIAIKHALEE